MWSGGVTQKFDPRLALPVAPGSGESRVGRVEGPDEEYPEPPARRQDRGALCEPGLELSRRPLDGLGVNPVRARMTYERQRRGVGVEVPAPERRPREDVEESRGDDLKLF